MLLRLLQPRRRAYEEYQARSKWPSSRLLIGRKFCKARLDPRTSVSPRGFQANLRVSTFIGGPMLVLLSLLLITSIFSLGFQAIGWEGLQTP